MFADGQMANLSCLAHALKYRHQLFANVWVLVHPGAVKVEDVDSLHAEPLQACLDSGGKLVSGHRLTLAIGAFFRRDDQAIPVEVLDRLTDYLLGTVGLRRVNIVYTKLQGAPDDRN